MNYLGSDTSEYQTYYTLQKANKPNPWDDLVRVCDELNNTPLTALEDTIDRYLDLDRTLWFLACEIAFSDDDSYVFKGKMDYALYWEPETGRITPHEYDGNSVLDSQNLNWAPFYHADNANYPLLNRLLQVQSIRQRYLAHMRTVRSELLATSVTQPVISGYQVLIDTMINNDPKKLMTYTQWQSAITTLQNAMNTRYTTIGNNFEVQQVAPTITTVDHVADGVLNGAPVAGSSVDVRATISGSTYAATLFWSNTIKGRFDRVAMVDDGAHNDGAAGDGVFGGSIPGQSSGTWVRYYIEAASTNAAHSVSYDPPGAEHDVYVYQTQVTPAPVTGVVINEVQSSNSFTAADENGQYEDWIELYNAGGQTVDLSGWYISDTPFDLTKWSIPPGTTIAPDQYLIAWCDEDQSQGAMHTNFKISASGETISLSSADTLLVDQVEVPALSTDQGYARVPNGTGDFVEQEPTFAANNNTVGVVEQEAPVLALFPNPATDQVTVITGSSSPVLVDVSDAMGRSVWRGAVVNGVELPTGHWSSGLYSVVAGGRSQKLVVNSR